MADLPPLTALRAFDAAARHLSFTRAGEALHVTHGAVSRQIKELEAFLCCALFVRKPRGLELTPQGRQLADTVGIAFEDMRRTVAHLRRDTRQMVITVSTVPSLAARWLVPRIAAYQAQHPGVEIRVATSHELADLQRDDVDIAVRHGRGPWPNVHNERLFETCLFPVCAPALPESGTLREPADLANVTLLHDMSYAYWAQWLEHAGVHGVDPRAGLVLQDSNVLLQAATEGQGVVLATLPLVDADLKAGRLVRPFEASIPVDLTFHVVCLPERLEDPSLKPFIEWLHAEAKRV
jgi:LysR family transcriptional regulator, glycine cleavage system transcriptional activator